MKLVYLTTIFVGSFLLFLVQPMLAKAFLPMVGGAPATWIICMLFFQVLLLGGYAYAAITSAYLKKQNQIVLHFGLMIVAAFTCFPITIGSSAVSAGVSPQWFLLSGLFSAIALPYFLLSANSSLLQNWYYKNFGGSPYHLFAASNAGSLIGLLGYPFAIEWFMSIGEQKNFWEIGYVFLIALVAILFFTQKAETAESIPATLGKNLPLKQILNVVFLGFVPSSLFLSTTLLVTTDIASFPLLWVIPLALYLLSFIIAFSKYSADWTRKSQKIAPVAMMICIFISMMAGATWFVFIYFVAFFIIAMSCHGELAKKKPEPDKLTAYYFWLSVGGALGGFFNTIAPYIFNDIYEFWIVLIASIFALPSNLYANTKFSKSNIKKAFSLFGVTLFSVTFIWSTPTRDAANDGGVLHKSRNFFGVSKVVKENNFVLFSHGTTLHGTQAVAEVDRLKPTTYYVPIKELIDKLNPKIFNKPFGMIGLGAGTVACYGKKGQEIDFFEIDQAVVDIASNPNYFTYMRDCPANKTIYVGDGRVELAKIPAQKYNLLVIDAFTSDSVPIHLLTREAIGIYINKIDQKDGLIAFNTSNRHINFVGVIANIAKSYNLSAYYLDYKKNKENDLATSSSWAVLLPTVSPHTKTLVELGYKDITDTPKETIWTDEYSNIISHIKWGNLF